MNGARENMIASLTEDLLPVSTVKLRNGAMLAAAAVLVTMLGVELTEGVWSGIWQGEAQPFFWVTNGILLLLGLASAAGAIRMAMPSVGNRHEAAKWTAATASLLPLAAIISLLPQSDPAAKVFNFAALHCFTSAFAASLLTFLALTLWLRRGAPVSLSTAGWMTGLAAGALGTFTYGMSCPLDSVPHLGILHVLPVIVMAMVGRLIVPRLVRW